MVNHKQKVLLIAKFYSRSVFLYEEVTVAIAYKYDQPLPWQKKNRFLPSSVKLVVHPLCKRWNTVQMDKLGG